MVLLKSQGIRESQTHSNIPNSEHSFTKNTTFGTFQPLWTTQIMFGTPPQIHNYLKILYFIMTSLHQFVFTEDWPPWSLLHIWMLLMAYMTNSILTLSSICSLAREDTIRLLLQVDCMVLSEIDGPPILPKTFLLWCLLINEKDGEI